jgi:hypothetical protein
MRKATIRYVKICLTFTAASLEAQTYPPDRFSLILARGPARRGPSGRDLTDRSMPASSRTYAYPFGDTPEHLRVPRTAPAHRVVRHLPGADPI